MEFTPPNIPRSLLPYLDQYKKEPEKAIQRLENHLQKRGSDAVGNYLLSLLYHDTGMKEKAVQAAWKARIFAPGSPAMERHHYFLQHPDKFEAWDPELVNRPVQAQHFHDDAAHLIPDLDSLIEKLSNIENSRIRLQEINDENVPDLGEDSVKVEDIVTETLAGIHEKQGNMKEAVRTYERLTEIHPEKADHYKEQINRLQNKSDD